MNTEDSHCIGIRSDRYRPIKNQRFRSIVIVLFVTVHTACCYSTFGAVGCTTISTLSKHCLCHRKRNIHFDSELYSVSVLGAVRPQLAAIRLMNLQIKMRQVESTNRRQHNPKLLSNGLTHTTGLVGSPPSLSTNHVTFFELRPTLFLSNSYGSKQI